MRFDLYLLRRPKKMLVVNVQADLLDDLQTRVVVPLLLFQSSKNEHIERFKPIIEYDKKKYILMTSEVSSIPVSLIQKTIGNVHHDREKIINALDFLFSGF